MSDQATHARIVWLLKQGDWNQVEDEVLAAVTDVKHAKRKLEVVKDRLNDASGEADWGSLADELLANEAAGSDADAKDKKLVRLYLNAQGEELRRDSPTHVKGDNFEVCRDTKDDLDRWLAVKGYREVGHSLVDTVVGKTIGNVQALRDVITSLPDEVRDGLEIYVQDGKPRLAVVDLLDWWGQDMKSQEANQWQDHIKAAVSEWTGDEARIVWQNEGGKPDKEDGWENVTKTLAVPEGKDKALGRKPYYRVKLTYYRDAEKQHNGPSYSTERLVYSQGEEGKQQVRQIIANAEQLNPSHFAYANVYEIKWSGQPGKERMTERKIEVKALSSSSGETRSLSSSIGSAGGYTVPSENNMPTSSEGFLTDEPGIGPSPSWPAKAGTNDESPYAKKGKHLSQSDWHDAVDEVAAALGKLPEHFGNDLASWTVESDVYSRAWNRIKQTVTRDNLDWNPITGHDQTTVTVYNRKDKTMDKARKRSELNDFIDAAPSLTDAQLTHYLEELGVPAAAQPAERQKKIDKIAFILREGSGTPGGGGLSRVNWRKTVQLCSVTNKWFVVKVNGGSEEREGPYDSDTEAQQASVLRHAKSGQEYYSRSVRKRLNKGQALTDDPDERRVITYCMTTEDVDRDGETVDPWGGAEWDEYANNQASQDNHDTDTLPVASLDIELAGPIPDGKQPVHPKVAAWKDYVGEGTEWPQVEGPRRPALLGNVYFSRENPKADQMYRQIKEGTLKGGSISFLPIGPVQRGTGTGSHYPKWKLLEFTICSIGSNPSAIALKVVKSLTDGKWYITADTPVRSKASSQDVGPFDSEAEAQAAVGKSTVAARVAKMQRQLAVSKAGKYPLITSTDSPHARLPDLKSDLPNLQSRIDKLKAYLAGTQQTTMPKFEIELEPKYREKEMKKLTDRIRKLEAGKSLTVVKSGYGWAVVNGSTTVSKTYLVKGLAVARLKVLEKSVDKGSGRYKVLIKEGSKWTEVADSDDFSDAWEHARVLRKQGKVVKVIGPEGEFPIKSLSFRNTNGGGGNASRLNRGALPQNRHGMRKRHWYGIGKSVILLKSEGVETSPETLAYLAERGYDDVSVVDDPPEEFDAAGVAPAAQPEQVAEHDQTREFQEAAGEGEDKGALVDWAQEEETEPEHQGKHMSKHFIVKTSGGGYVTKDGDVSDEPETMSLAKAVAVAKEMSNVIDAKVEPWPTAENINHISRENTPVASKFTDTQTPVGSRGDKRLRKDLGAGDTCPECGYRLNIPGDVSRGEAECPNCGWAGKQKSYCSAIEVGRTYRVHVKGAGYLTKGGTTEDADDAEMFSLGKAVEVAKEFDGKVEEMSKGADLEGDALDPEEATQKQLGHRKDFSWRPGAKVTSSKFPGTGTVESTEGHLTSVKLGNGRTVLVEGYDLMAKSLHKASPLDSDAENTQGVPVEERAMPKSARVLRKHIKELKKDIDDRDFEHDVAKSALKTCHKHLSKTMKRLHKDLADDGEAVDKWCCKVGRKSWVTKADKLTDEPQPMCLEEAQQKAEDHDGEVEELKYYTVKCGKRYVSKSGKLESDPQPVLAEEAKRLQKATDGDLLDYAKALEEEDEDLEAMDDELKSESPPVIESKADGYSLVDDEGKTVEGPFDDKEAAVKALKHRMFRKSRRVSKVADDAKAPLEEALKFVKELSISKAAGSVWDWIVNRGEAHDGDKRQFLIVYPDVKLNGKPVTNLDQVMQFGDEVAVDGHSIGGPKSLHLKSDEPEELKSIRQRAFFHAKAMEDALEERALDPLDESEMTKSEIDELKSKAEELDAANTGLAEKFYRSAGVRI